MSNIEEMNVKITFSHSEQPGDKQVNQTSFAVPVPPSDSSSTDTDSQGLLYAPPSPNDHEVFAQGKQSTTNEFLPPPPVTTAVGSHSGNLDLTVDELPPPVYENDVNFTSEFEGDIAPPEEKVKVNRNKGKRGSSSAKK